MNCKDPIRIRKNLNPREYPDGLLVPCGKCLNCRIQKRTEWSMRLWHESEIWKEKVYLTLTYDEDNIPQNRSLRKTDLQKFFKRVRKRMKDRKIKYFACGEYGEETERPHYHAIVFGLGLSENDKQIVKDCWKFQNWKVVNNKCFGLVEPDSIAYVCGYIHSKLSGDMAEEEYEKKGREPVFKIQSQGFGKTYIKENQQTLSNKGFCTVKGVRRSIPRYYLEQGGIDNQKAKEYQNKKEVDFVKEATGLNLSFDELYKLGSVDQNKVAIDKKRAQRNQNDKNQKAKITKFKKRAL